MKNEKDMIKWLNNLKSDIGQPQHSQLWHYAEILDVIAKYLENTQRTGWIPVSERLPEVGQDVIFCDGRWTEEGCLRADGDWWQFRWSMVKKKEEVTAWQPLPEPYKGGDDE